MAPNAPTQPPVLRHDSILSIHEAQPPLPKKRKTTVSSRRCQKTPNTPPSPLLRLPAELRLQIYSYLTPPIDDWSTLPTTSRPCRERNIGASTISHHPPPLSLLLSCRQINAEALDEFYRTSVWCFERLLDPRNAWALYQMECVFWGSAAFARVRCVEISGFWHPLPKGELGGGGTAVWAGLYGLDAGLGTGSGVVPWAWSRAVCEEVCRRKERIARVVDVLSLAPALRTVVVTWKEVSKKEDEVDEGWAVRNECLRPLEKLKGRVQFRIGDVVGSRDVGEGVMGYVKELNCQGRRVRGGILQDQ